MIKRIIYFFVLYYIICFNFHNNLVCQTVGGLKGEVGDVVGRPTNNPFMFNEIKITDEKFQGKRIIPFKDGYLKIEGPNVIKVETGAYVAISPIPHEMIGYFIPMLIPKEKNGITVDALNINLLNSNKEAQNDYKALNFVYYKYNQSKHYVDLVFSDDEIEVMISLYLLVAKNIEYVIVHSTAKEFTEINELQPENIFKNILISETTLQNEPSGVEIDKLVFGTKIKVLHEKGIWMKVMNLKTNKVGWIHRFLTGSDKIIKVLRDKNKKPIAVAFFYYSITDGKYNFPLVGQFAISIGRETIIPRTLVIIDNSVIKGEEFSKHDEISVFGKVLVSPKSGSIYYYNENHDFEEIIF